MSDDLIERLLWVDLAGHKYKRRSLDREGIEQVTAALAAKDTALSEMRAELTDLQGVFDIRWEADRRAIKEWQEITGRKTVWPDHVDLVCFLAMALELEAKRAAAAEAELERARKALEPFAKYAAITFAPVNIRDSKVELGIYASNAEAEITVGDFRAAARALAPSIQDEGGAA